MDEIRGTRYPIFGFVTGGTGAFNDGIPPQSYETFAYDLALHQAGIENFNVIPYTSVLPPEMRGNLVTIKELFHNFINIPSDNPFDYCLTAIGFLNFGYAPLAK